MGSSGRGLFSFTEDYGSTWVGQETPASLERIKFVNDTVGFLIGSFSGTWKTLDGGLTWHESEVDELGTGMLTIFKALSMFDESMGYGISQNGIYKTTNSGGLGTEVVFHNEYLNYEEITETEILLFPNPAENLIELIGVEIDGRLVQVYDQTGKLVCSIMASSQKINVSHLDSGIYLLHFVEYGTPFNLRFVKK
jgi:hypothetical protein